MAPARSLTKYEEHVLHAAVRSVKTKMIVMCVSCVILFIATIYLNVKYGSLVTDFELRKVEESKILGIVKDLENTAVELERDLEILTASYRSVEQCEEVDVDYPVPRGENVVFQVKVSTWQQCQGLCQREPRCIAWTYVSEKYADKDYDEECRLKDYYTEKSAVVGFYSGIRDCKDKRINNASIQVKSMVKYEISQFEELINNTMGYLVGYRSNNYANYLNKCPVYDYMYTRKYIPYYNYVDSWKKCSDICRAHTPVCLYWSWFIDSNLNQCYVVTSDTFRDFYAVNYGMISGTRTCGQSVLSEFLSYHMLQHFSKYHASFVGYGCHAEGCVFSNTTEHIIQAVGTPLGCVSSCYVHQQRVTEATYSMQDQTCYCRGRNVSANLISSFHEDIYHMQYVFS